MITYKVECSSGEELIKNFEFWSYAKEIINCIKKSENNIYKLICDYIYDIFECNENITDVNINDYVCYDLVDDLKLIGIIINYKKNHFENDNLEEILSKKFENFDKNCIDEIRERYYNEYSDFDKKNIIKFFKENYGNEY